MLKYPWHMINRAVIKSGVWVIGYFNGMSCFEKIKKIKKNTHKIEGKL